SDCIAASDEYRYEDSNGNIVCKKSSEGSDLKYYWKFEGYGAKCNSDITKEKIYGCYYKDKNNKAIQVTKSHCTSVSKPNSSSVACEKPWTVLGWGACSKSCGGGTQTRSVTCDAGYNCSNYPQPINSQACNTNTCAGVWLTGGWGRCSALDQPCNRDWGFCYFNGTQYRSVWCSNGYCPSAKPPASQGCSARVAGDDDGAPGDRNHEGRDRD
ncbi:MAG TPA: hypothetical protein DCL21_03010, partial [Alphaproteobacteria bacterium]|nr:hypothetical protein [Alphaproteobacteria bacterium]